ncbi:DUF7882 family protein [Microbacterium sp. CJ88]|uniref:DUF7882 family protein n=1 Tax=Microbacterium sp. CJ88 TaxID=3445672 RepID=UPI003F659898
MSLRFVFHDLEPVKLNQQWLAELARSANSSAGITLVREHLIAATGEADTPQTRSAN